MMREGTWVHGKVCGFNGWVCGDWGIYEVQAAREEDFLYALTHLPTGKRHPGDIISFDMAAVLARRLTAIPGLMEEMRKGDGMDVAAFRNSILVAMTETLHEIATPPIPAEAAREGA